MRGKKALTTNEVRKLKKLGMIVRAERERQKLTLYGVEDRGYPFYQHWQAVERGERDVTFITILRICSVLGTTPSALLEDL